LTKTEKSKKNRPTCAGKTVCRCKPGTDSLTAKSPAMEGNLPTLWTKGGRWKKFEPNEPSSPKPAKALGD